MAYAVGRWQEGMDPDIKERIPESTHGVYWGPYSTQPRDHEVTLDHQVYLKGLEFCKKGDTLYVLAKEVER